MQVIQGINTILALTISSKYNKSTTCVSGKSVWVGRGWAWTLEQLGLLVEAGSSVTGRASSWLSGTSGGGRNSRTRRTRFHVFGGGGGPVMILVVMVVQVQISELF